MPYEPKPAWMGVIEPGSSLPGVAHGGGFAPSQSEAAMADVQRRFGGDIARYLLANDPSARMLSGMVADAVTGGGAASRQWMQSDTGKAVNLGLGALLNSGPMRESRGSVLDLFAGVSNAVSGGGMQMGIGNTGGMQISGRGAVTDNVSRLIYQQLRDTMWSPGGAGNLGRTQGFNLSQVGDIAGELASRGAFRGMNVGTMSAYTAADLDRMTAAGGASAVEAARIRAQGGGWKPMELDSAFKDHFQSTVEAAARPLRQANDIFGNRPIHELMKMSEQLSGMSFTEAGGSGEIHDRLRQVKALAAASGFTGEQVARFDMTTASLLNMSGIDSRTSAFMAGSIVPETFSAYNGYQVKRRIAAENGTYVPEVSREEFAGTKASAMARVMQEDQGVVAASVLKQTGTLSASQSAQLDALQQAYGSATTIEARNQARANLSSAVSEISHGRDPIQVNNTYSGGKGVFGAAAILGTREMGMVTQTYSDTINSRQRGDALLDKVDNLYSKSDYDAISNPYTDTSRGGLSNLMGDFFGKLESGKQEQIIEDLQKNGGANIESILKDSEMSDDDKSSLKKRLTDIRDYSNGDGKGITGAQSLGADLRKMQVARDGDERMRGESSDADRAIADRAVRNRKAEAVSLGDGVAAGGFMETMFRAIAGGTNFSDADVIQYGINSKTGNFLDIRKGADGTSLAATDANVEDLKKMIPNLASVLGTDDAGIKGALATGKGYDALTSYAVKNKLAFSGSADGGFRIGSAADTKKATEALELESRRYGLGQLIGDDKVNDKMLKDPVAQGKAIANNMGEILKALDTDPTSNRATAFNQLAKSDPLRAQAAFSSFIRDNTDEKGKAKKGSEKEVESAKHHLKDLQETSSSDYIGKLTMVLGEDVVMQLFRAKGLQQ